MRVLVMLGVLAGGLVGCAVPDYNYQAPLVDVSRPPVDVESVAYVGDEMLARGRYLESEALYFPRQISFGWAYTASQGYYVKKGEDAKTETFLPEGGNEGGQIEKTVMADRWQALMRYKGTQRLCMVAYNGSYLCEDDADFTEVRRPIKGPDAFQQTLIYNGKSGDKINVGYREFSNSMARPAFNNDVEYDLGASSVVGYKGARLEVIEATNELIRYRVLNTFRPL